MLAAFALYGTDHIGAITVISAVAITFIYLCRKKPSSLAARFSIWTLTFLCLASYSINQLAWLSIGGAHSLDAILPCHLCDIAAFICGFALITRNPLLCELAYFWGLAGTIQGLITPNLTTSFPNPQFIAFFILHGAIVITALTLPLGLGWKPRPHAVRRVFVWVFIYAAIATVVNITLETNFAYLRHKPQGSSLLDVMGQWPYYILCLIAVSGLLLYALSLPFRFSSGK